MINIAELLKDAPSGMKLYSPLFGEVTFCRVEGNNIYVVLDQTGCSYTFSEHGKPFHYSNAECLLFPSKEVRTWEGWKAPIEPKFKVGDWVVTDYGKVSQVVSVDNAGDGYTLDDGVYFSGSWCDMYHLWSIADAKDGDVLVTTKIRNCPFIYRKTDRKNNLAYYYAGIDGDGDFSEGCLKRTLFHFGSVENVVPATKEQRDLLFAKMKDAGYEWDADKKELHKIKPHYNIANFKPFDKVLVRCSNDEEWMIEFYCKYDTLVHTSPHRDYPFMGIGDSYSQCIPYEGNEHLLGTTDMCDEMYINW